jgi:hypothetical protein
MALKDGQKARDSYGREIRRRLIDFYGGKCVHCGCDEFEALELNHKRGGGYKEKRGRHRKDHLSTTTISRKILNGELPADDYEIACRVCNSVHYLTEIKGVKGKWTVSFSKQ